MKKFIKNISLLLIVLFVTATFSACGNLNSQIIYNADGSIDELVSIELETEEILASGYNINDIKLWIYQEGKSQVDKIILAYNESLLNDINVADEENKNKLKDLQNGLTMVLKNWQNNLFKIGLKFASLEVYKYYYNIAESSSEPDEIKKGFFFNEYVFYSGTEFTKHRALFNSLSNKFNEKYPNIISEDDELTYTYVTSSKRVHSNANSVIKYAGYYYHTWEINSENIDEPVKLYYRVANPQNWILLALGLTCALLLILGCVGFIISRKNKYKNEQKIVNKNLLQKLFDRINNKN